MTWLNWSLKLHSKLRTIPHLIYIYTQHTFLMLNKYLIHLFDCTCLNVMCVYSSIYGSNQKYFWSFYMYLEVIFITLCVHVLCLHCFSLLKHVLCWKTGVRIFGYSFWLLSWVASFGYSFWRLAQSRVYIEWFATHSRLISLLASRKMPKNSFLKNFSRETCFKPLSSSFKPLFQYFYIKIQSIWMIFHFINISKEILNSFIWFLSFRLCFGEFLCSWLGFLL